MLSSILIMDLMQEAAPAVSYLKILNNHEVLVGTVFNHLACVWIIFSSNFILSKVFHPSILKSINNRAHPILLSQSDLRAILLSNIAI